MRANGKRFGSAAFELKQTTEDSIPFSDVQPHQIDALLTAKRGGGLLYKAPDDSRGMKPFDLFFLTAAEAYVVIRFPNCFTVIDVEVFIEEKAKSQRKSLTWYRAQAIAKFVIEI